MGRLLKWQLFSLFIFIFHSSIFASTTYAYIPSVTSTGKPVHWKLPAKLKLMGNPINQSGLNPQNFYDAMVLGLQRWKQASDGRIDFDYWQGTDWRFKLSNLNYNGISNVFFGSQSEEVKKQLSANVLGLTQVWYSSDTGEIFEADIVLNDVYFKFTNNPRDTSGYGSDLANSTRDRTRVYIQNVVTHELGHAQGLSHSGGLQSSMLFMESPEQAHLDCDELAAMYALYPSAEINNKTGNLIGKIHSPSGNPIYGAHVLALSQRRGTVLETALTDKKGQFTLKGLEPGSYIIVAEPYYAGSNTLPSYYSEIDSSICPNKTPFSRTFLSQADGLNLTSIPVRAGETSYAPTIVVQCRALGAAATINHLESSAGPNIPALRIEDSSRFGIVDEMSSPGDRYYHLPNISGHVEIYALAYSLYSPLHPSLELYNDYGNLVKTSNLDPVYASESGFVNYDSALVADSLPSGDYSLRVSANRLESFYYPAGPLSLDSAPFVVLVGSLNEDPPPLMSHFPMNARCRAKENFATYQGPSGPPPSSASTDGQGFGFCSQTSAPPNAPPNSPNADTPVALFSWALPWLTMLLGWPLTRTLSRLRSSSQPANLEL